MVNVNNVQVPKFHMVSYAINPALMLLMPYILDNHFTNYTTIIQTVVYV